MDMRGACPCELVRVRFKIRRSWLVRSYLIFVFPPAAGKGSGLFAETAATCVVVCEMIEELVSPFAPPALCGWWQDLAKPGLAGAAESARSRQVDAYAWVAEAAQRWTHSSRVRSVAPGSVAVPMMATIDEDEQEDMHEEG